jgi:hypothetical protein
MPVSATTADTRTIAGMQQWGFPLLHLEECRQMVEPLDLEHRRIRLQGAVPVDGTSTSRFGRDE